MENVKSIKTKSVIGVCIIAINNNLVPYGIVLNEYEDGETTIDLEPI